MSEPADSSGEIAEAAARWLARRDRGLSPQEEREFAAWRDADPRHAEEWASLTETWNALDSAGAVPDLAAEAAAIDRRTLRAQRRGKLFRWALPVGLAAGVALVAGLSLFRNAPRNSTPSAPAAAPAVVLVASEAKRLTLPDGSLVDARGDSAVTFDFTGPDRRVKLAQGEAFFTVAHDAAHPFIVDVDGVAVRAVGTAFNVRRDSDRVDVIVTEGRVRVAPARAAVDFEAAPLVSAGAAAHVDSAHANNDAAVETRALTSVEIEGALAWRSPLLEFSRASLDQVLSAFREHTAHRVRLADPALGRRLISGTFQADNIDGFLRLAEATFGLQVERLPGGDILLRAAP